MIPADPKNAPTTTNAADAGPPRIPAGLFWTGLACLLLAIAASAILSGKHLDLLIAPGCGAGSGCERAAASAWGKVPLVGWPVSYLGVAYFAALAGTWILIGRRRRPVPNIFRTIVRLGAAFSAMFLVVMIVGGYVCPYCVAAHVGNFGFLAVLETAPAAAIAGRAIVGWAAGLFIIVTGIQLGADVTVRGIVREQAEQDLQQATDEVIAAQDETPPGDPADENRPIFTGRYRKGPEVAPIRLVIFSDYQCPDCSNIEGQVRRVLEKYPDIVSYSHKQNPISTDCNPFTNRNLHPNACWAARAAEAAGILRGNEGFWQMHEWLFDVGGEFDYDTLNAALVRMGYDPEKFVEVLRGDRTLQLVKDDIDEGVSYGLMRTPMIFINGVELKGWMAPDALVKAIDRLAAAPLTPRDASHDRPPSAFQKVVADWQESPIQGLPRDSRPWTLGPKIADVEVVVWGDLQEPYSARADKILREITASRDDVSYAFRDYPIDQACNPVTPRTLHPKACFAARAAEAAGSLGGSDAYWAMHEWLFANIDTLDEQTLRAAAADMGLDADKLLAEMDSEGVSAAIVEDAEDANQLGLRSVPFIYINGKRVPRWNVDGALAAMVEKASRTASPLRP